MGTRKFYQKRIFFLAERHGVKYGSPEFHMKVKERDDLRREFDDMLGTNGVFIYPTHPTVAPYHNEPIIRAFNFSYTAIINLLGLPVCVRLFSLSF